MRVTMVGTSGSGKTAYMAGLESALGPESVRSDGFSIEPTPTNPDDLNIEDRLAEVGRFHEISWAGRKLTFPNGTDSTTLWSFDLMHQRSEIRDRNVVSEFHWMDYRGGALDDAVSGKVEKPDVTGVIKGVVASQAIIIFADAFLSTYYDNIKTARRFTGASTIYTILDAYHHVYPKRNLTYLIVMTKCDGLDPKWQERNYEPLIDRGLEIFEPLVRLTRSNRHWTGGIMAMSAVGEGNAKRTVLQEGTVHHPPQVENVIVGEPEPYNAEFPLFYCIGNILSNITRHASDSAQKIEDDIIDAMERDSLMTRVLSIISRKQTPRAIAEELRKKQERDYEIIEKYEPFVQPLIASTMRVVREIR